jgi:alpha-galactosidase
MHDEIKTVKTFVIDNDDGDTYTVEVFPDRTYITQMPKKDGHPEEVVIVLATNGLPELLERLASFVRSEKEQ